MRGTKAQANATVLQARWLHKHGERYLGRNEQERAEWEQMKRELHSENRSEAQRERVVLGGGAR